MDGSDADTRIAALTAIVQTLILEHYWEEDEEEAKRRFLALAEADHPVAMVIVNELTDQELDAAFRWPRESDAEPGGVLPATPVIGFLTEEQYERARVTAVAEDEGERARTFVAEVPGVPGAAELPACERIRLAEERFVSAMHEDLVRRRGEAGHARGQGTVDETIAAMPEPWKSRTRRELERLREDLGEMLGNKPGADSNDSTGHTPLSSA